jgi:hypothetical protein
MGRSSPPLRTAFDAAPELMPDARLDSTDFADEFGGFARAENTGKSSAITMAAPRKFSTDTRPPRIQ